MVKARIFTDGAAKGEGEIERNRLGFLIYQIGMVCKTGSEELLPLR